MTITYNTPATALFHYTALARLGCKVMIDNRTVTVRKVSLRAARVRRSHLIGQVR
jgi:hypothetical protein